MAADLGLVAHPAHADADELTPHGPGDALAQAGLAHAGRPDEAQDGAGDLSLELLYRQELEDAVFHVLQVVVVLVQDLPAVRHVQVVGGVDRPGQRHDPVEIGTDHAVLGGRRRQLRQAVHLPGGLLEHFFGQVRLLDLLAQFVGLRLGLVHLPQLVLDGFELLAQDVLPLALVHLGLDLVLDLGAQLQHFQLAVHEGGEAAQALGEVDLFEKFLLVLGLQAHGRRDEVAQCRGVVDVGCGQLELVRQIRDQLDDLGVDRDEVALQRLEFGARHHDVGQVVHRGGEVGLFGDEPVHLDAPYPLGDDAQGAVGRLDHLLDGGQHADHVDVFGARRFDVGPFGRHEAHLLVTPQDIVDEGDRAGLAHCQRGHGVGEHHRVFEGQDGQYRG